MEMVFVRYDDMNEAQKAEIFNIIDTFIDCSLKAWKEGILALEDDVNKLVNKAFPKNCLYMKRVLQFVIDGVDENVLIDIGKTLISSSTDNDFEKMCFEMILEGTMGIQRGENPHILAQRLSAYMGIVAGETFIEKEFAKIDSSDFSNHFENQIDSTDESNLTE